MKQISLLKKDLAYLVHLLEQDETTESRCIREGSCYRLIGKCGDCEFLSTDIRRQETKRFIKKQFESLYETL